MRANTASDFWARVNKTDDCWLWTGGKFSSGYGRFSIKGETWHAHRFAWADLGHELVDGLVLDHLCHVRHCVNPRHIRQVTARDNARNRWGATGSSASGYRGVSYSKYYAARGWKPWQAHVRTGGRRKYLGYFATPEEAALAAADYRAKIYGDAEVWDDPSLLQLRDSATA